MANMHLVTGCAGYAHIKAEDTGSFNTLLLGEDQYVLDRGNKFAASMLSDNQVRILDGEMMMQGRFIRLEPDMFVDLTIDNGEQGYFRNDLIVARYTRDENTNHEEMNLVVIKGVPTSASATDPEYTVGNIIDDHAVLNDIPLWRIPLDGLTAGTPECLFTVVSTKTLLELQERTNPLTEETVINDNDFFAFYDESASEHRKIKWSNMIAKTVEAGNDLPVTSAAVYAVVGDLEALLDSI